MNKWGGADEVWGGVDSVWGIKSVVKVLNKIRNRIRTQVFKWIKGNV
jgi:hypothetical protein